MEDKQFNLAMKEYRCLMADAVDAGSGMDWVSDLYVHGTRNCVELVDRYLSDNASVLEFGCGMGLVAVLLGKLGYRVTGLDIDIGNQPELERDALEAPWGSLETEIEHPMLLSDCWNRLTRNFGSEFLAFDGKDIPLENSSFDGVVSHAVYEHISPDQLPGTVEEINRVLKSNGLFFIFRTPRKEAYLENLADRLGLGTHKLIFSESEVETLVSKHGFRLIGSNVTDMLPSFPPFGLNIYNLFSPCLTRLDYFLLNTRFRKYAHHMTLIFRKAC